MIRKIVLSVFIFTAIFAGCSDTELPDLRISENGRYFETLGGEPFFWFGDTDWVMFHRTSPADAETYFSDRAGKGFNVIQASLTGAGVNEGVLDPSHNVVNGLLPFHFTDSIPDPTRPDEAFFAHADRMIDLAGEYGLYVGLLPTWAEYVCPAWHNGPRIFTLENARHYGEYLGKRYADKSNIIWIIGGDRNPYKCDSSDIEIWRAMAAGIREHDSRHLMTFHPQGNSCSDEWFHNDDWLDFNMYQSIRWPQNIVSISEKAWAKEPVKPVVNGEPFYFENRQIDTDFDDGIFRAQPYWSFIAGNRGYTFGQHHIWFFDKNDEFLNFETNTGIYWYDKLDTEGTRWTMRAIELIRSVDWWKFIPDNSLVIRGTGEGTRQTVACRTGDYSSLMVYFPCNEAAVLDLSGMSSRPVLTWYRTDKDESTLQEPSSLRADGLYELKPPEGWQDALLLIN